MQNSYRTHILIPPPPRKNNGENPPIFSGCLPSEILFLADPFKKFV